METGPRPPGVPPADPGEATLDLARRVLRVEAEAVGALADRLDERFDTALTMLIECRGRVIATGMGKSGIIARKLAATLSSTGTPSYFIHPAEAVHGDLGAIQPSDVVVGLSQSGETPEILRLLETIRRLGARLIAMTGAPASSLGEARRRYPRLRRAHGSLPAEPRPDGQYDRGAGARRRTGHGAAGPQGISRGGLRPPAPGRATRENGCSA